jgi:hypothetical protein
MVSASNKALQNINPTIDFRYELSILSHECSTSVTSPSYFIVISAASVLYAFRYSFFFYSVLLVAVYVVRSPHRLFTRTYETENIQRIYILL